MVEELIKMLIWLVSVIHDYNGENQYGTISHKSFKIGTITIDIDVQGLPYDG